MNETTRQRVRGLGGGATGALLALSATVASAQSSPAAPAAGANDPNPYYVGISQGLTHDSNVYRIPNGPSDNYSSTSLFGGFDQPISRQRLFGRASVSVNRYQDQTPLNNVSYDLTSGANLETVENISGDVNLGLNRHLAATAASVAVPSATRNVAQTERIDAHARWGGVSLLTLEGSAGYSRVDYSAPEFVASETRQDTESLALYYRPGGPLRLGVAGRTTHTKTPQALFDSTSGTFQSNTVRSNNVDLLADYDVTGIVTANGRLSYTRQTNSSVGGADFSGVTGSLGVDWQATGKIRVRLDASRDAGFDSSRPPGYVAPPVGSTTPVSGPIAGLYENNRVTNTIALGVSYAATAKISADAKASYARAKLATTTSSSGTSTSSAETADVLQSISLGATYAITRAWNAACNVAHENRDVSGAVVYSYKANTVGCTTQFIWR